MGLDFRIDCAPTCAINGEPATARDVMRLAEESDLLTDETTIVITPLPPLTERCERPTWSYSGFGHFRRRIAADLGFDIDQMRGFSGDAPCIEWRDVPAGDLRDLLHHSDCDGDLTPEQCAVIGPALLAHAARWEGVAGAEYDRTMAERLARMMSVCMASGRRLLFC